MAEAAPSGKEVTLVANNVGGVGGMERQLTELVNGLLAAGDRVTVISWTCDLPPHPGLRWIRVPGPSRPFSIAYPWFMLAASALAGLRGRGLLHSTGAIVLGRVDVCTVHFCHRAFGTLPSFSRASRPGLAYRANARVAGAMSRLAERWCYRPRRARRLVGVSTGVARELHEHFPRMRERIEVIPNGVDTEAFHPPPEGRDGGPLKALFVGGEWERKGLKVALEAVALSPPAELVVIGEGDADSYGRLAERLGVADRVRFVGAVDAVAEWYRRGDVFVLPTAYETFSLVTYEAAASGLPLLVTKVNGVEDLLREGVNGWFVDREAELVADRLRRLQSDPGLRREMGGRAREDSLRFSWSRVVEDYRRLYAAGPSALERSAP